MRTYFCLACGELKQGDRVRIELNICEECAPSDDSEEDKRYPILNRMG